MSDIKTEIARKTLKEVIDKTPLTARDLDFITAIIVSFEACPPAEFCRTLDGKLDEIDTSLPAEQ
jgi:hypothetical protein